MASFYLTMECVWTRENGEFEDFGRSKLLENPDVEDVELNSEGENDVELNSEDDDDLDSEEVQQKTKKIKVK